MGGYQPLLAVDADLVEQDVPAVAQQLLVAQVYFGFQGSAPGCQLSAISYQLSAFSFQLSAFSFQLSIAWSREHAGCQKRIGPAQ
jgi:hypothetical protein